MEFEAGGESFAQFRTSHSYGNFSSLTLLTGERVEAITSREKKRLVKSSREVYCVVRGVGGWSWVEKKDILTIKGRVGFFLRAYEIYFCRGSIFV